MPDQLARLQRWYVSQCNGDWEHGHGVAIGTLDNPGWTVTVDLTDTELAGRAFVTVEENYSSETEWLRCWVIENRFEARGGPAQLGRMLEVFLDWADSDISNDVAPAS